MKHATARCLSNTYGPGHPGHYENTLTVGKIYEIEYDEWDSTHTVYFTAADGTKKSCSISRFQLLPNFDPFSIEVL